MPRFHLPVIQSFKAPDSDREVQLRLYNHVYMFTSTVGTQTESEVFYMNGKPARAVHPFRVVPKKPREIVTQMAELELALAGQAIPVYNTQAVANVQYLTAWQPAPLEVEEQPFQEVAAPALPEQPEQEEMTEASAPPVPERQSQETQTEMELFEDEGTDTASASEDSNAE